MSDLVIDASVALYSAQLAVLTTGTIYAPELIDVELASAMRKLALRGALHVDAATTFISEWSANVVVRCAHALLLPRVWELRNTITAYDASYVALAESLRIPLATADLRLARAAANFCDVITIEG